MIRRPPRSTQSRSSAASDVYKRQTWGKPKPTLHHSPKIRNNISEQVRSDNYVKPFRVFHNPHRHSIDEIKLRFYIWIACGDFSEDLTPEAVNVRHGIHLVDARYVSLPSCSQVKRVLHHAFCPLS